jgi:hypothetical protein
MLRPWRLAASKSAPYRRIFFSLRIGLHIGLLLTRRTNPFSIEFLLTAVRNNTKTRPGRCAVTYMTGDAAVR